jgi:thiol-disulfide isomerase/thioredoxin
VALTGLVVYALTRSTTSTHFEATGAALPLPPAGRLTPLTEPEFEGVLVGLRGKPVIVNIWASWCGPCRAEMPLLERAWEAHKDEVVILGVASKDAPGPSLAFMNEFGITYPNVFRRSAVDGHMRASGGANMLVDGLRVV